MTGKLWLAGLLTAVSLTCSSLVLAQEGEVDSKNETAEQFVASLNFKEGEIAVRKARARFKLTPEFRYLEQADARRVLEDFWNNPPDDSVLGLIVPRQPSLLEEGSWAVVVTYSDEGYISDEDASKINYGELLKEMKESTREGNAERVKAGYGTMELLGWAVPPRYDSINKKLYWAKKLSFNGESDHVLNYDIRVLGRHGYLSLEAVAGMSELPQVRQGMQKLLKMTEFDTGARYADYNASTDKTAAYGLGALIGGGLAAKAGLFGKIGLLLVKFWKILVIGVIAVGASLVGAIKRKFTQKKAKGTIS